MRPTNLDVLAHLYRNVFELALTKGVHKVAKGPDPRADMAYEEGAPSRAATAAAAEAVAVVVSEAKRLKWQPPHSSYAKEMSPDAVRRLRAALNPQEAADGQR